MNNSIIRSRLLGSTAALSVLLGSVNPMPLRAQSVDTNSPGNSGLTRENCQNADGTACSQAEFRQQRQLQRQQRGETDAEVTPSNDPDAEIDTPPGAETETLTEPGAVTTSEPLQVPQPPAAAQPEALTDDAPTSDVTAVPEGGDQPADSDQSVMDEATAPDPDQDPDDTSEPQSGATETSEDAEADAAGDTPEIAAESESDLEATAEIDPPTPTEEAIDTLKSLLTVDDDSDDASEPPAAAAAAAEGSLPAADATVTTITEADSRSSAEEFTDTSAAAAESRRSGLSNFEKVGLVALGALVVGAIVNNRGDEVVENSGDRVVVRRNDGKYYVLKDDDTLLRRPGATVRSEAYTDGSTLSVVERDDGSRIVTIRDASGRVLRRARFDAEGRETVLIDDIAPVERVDVSRLPAPRPDFTISTTDDGASLRTVLAEIEARENARAYSLRQIRDIREVRAMAPAIQIEAVTFATGSSAIRAEEAEKLSRLGVLLREMIRTRPNEVFLVEGHTDAIGSASSNLALSDRRAESVALALTEYFDVPPENLVVQGYGEGDLLIPTDAAEQRNRRVVVRLITPFLSQAALR